MNKSHLKYSDWDFIKELSKVASLKEGQAAPALAPPEDASASNVVVDLAKKLVQQLKDARDITASKVDTELYPKDLVDLPSAIRFLHTEQMKSDGKYIVSNVQEPGRIPFSIEGVEVGDNSVAMPGQNTVYVDKNGLIKYFQQLQKTAADPESPNEVLGVMVGKLIEQANKELQLGIKPQTTPTGGDQSNKKTQQPGSNQQAQQGQSSAQPWTPGQALNAQQLQSLAPISNAYPFFQDRIDFRAIDQWLTAYFSAIQNFKGVNLGLENATMAKQYVTAISQGWGLSQQALTATADEIYIMIKSKAEARSMEATAAESFPFVYLQYVQKLVLYLESTLLDFKSVFYKSFPPDWRKDLDDQVSNSGSSLAFYNKGVVQQWINNLPAAQARIEKGR